ncbi:hypothetical protein [Methylobacter sp.]|uniref:hypothetical protein n=1 Tax=Methylobacter sp. TaxID=2051955 RepID=UPI0025D15D0C|nr:hypothetical protein [Methylobacter sp.]
MAARSQLRRILMLALITIMVRTRMAGFMAITGLGHATMVAGGEDMAGADMAGQVTVGRVTAGEAMVGGDMVGVETEDMRQITCSGKALLDRFR